MTPPPPLVCTNCGAPVHGPYCSECGERQPDPERFKFKTFAGQAVEEFTDVEHSKLYRTLRTLVTQPGELTRQYMCSRQKSYIGPLKLYLVFFVLMLSLYTLYRPTHFYDLQAFMEADATGTWRTLLERVATKAGLGFETFVSRANAKVEGVVSLTSLVYPIFVALALKLLFIGRGRTFVEHLIFALHYSSLIKIAGLLAWPLYAVIGLKMTIPYFALAAALVGWELLYAILAVRRAYGEDIGTASWKGLLVFIAYYFATVAVLYAAIAYGVIATVFEGHGQG